MQNGDQATYVFVFVCVCAHSPAVQQRLQMALSTLSCWWSQMEWFLTWSRPKRLWSMWVHKHIHIHTHACANKHTQRLIDGCGFFSHQSLHSFVGGYFSRMMLSKMSTWEQFGVSQQSAFSDKPDLRNTIEKPKCSLDFLFKLQVREQKEDFCFHCDWSQFYGELN